MTSAKLFSGELIEILRTPFFTEHLLIGNFQGKHLHWSPVPVTFTRICLVTLLKWVSINSIFKRILRLCFGKDIQQKGSYDALHL